MKTKSPSRLTIIAFLIIILFAGNNAIAVRLSNLELPPFFGAAIRFAAAALILFALVLIFRLPLPRGRSLLGAVLFGALGTGLNYALLYWALEQLQASLSMVILALVPLMTLLFAIAHRQEIFRWKAFIGAILAVVGIGIIVQDRLSANVPLLPLLAVVGAAACFSESTVILKTYPRTHPITTNAIAVSTGAGFLFIFSALWREKPVLPRLPATWGALMYLILFGTVATFVLSVYVITHWTASASSYQFVLFPLVTIPVGAIMANERVNIALLLGGAFVLAGVYIGAIAKPEQWKGKFSNLLPRTKSPSPEKLK
jgi:drug/metabolite transporter (DMT)-like permease